MLPIGALVKKGPDLKARPLDAESYARFGDVISARGSHRPANQGTARKFEHLAELTDLRAGQARPHVSLFRCAPYATFPFEVTLLEKHPRSTQLFIPMNARKYLVVVALGHVQAGAESGRVDCPDLSTLSAFVVGSEGITYRPGTWHHPLIALEALSPEIRSEVDFACLVFEDGTADDCVEVELAPDERPRIFLP